MTCTSDKCISTSCNLQNNNANNITEENISVNDYLCKPHCILYKWKFKADFHEMSCKQSHNLIQTYFTPEIFYFSMKCGGMAVYHEVM